MTIVAALRSMGRIVVMSDTMISDERSHRTRKRIPGRLKSIVLNRWLTVSYAGLSIQSIDTIRELKAANPTTTDAAVDYLRDVAANQKNEVDFLVCSHERPDRPRLIKISGERASEGQDFYWIGSPTAAGELARLELPAVQGESGGEYFSIEETRFTYRFHQYIKHATDPSVGGMVINCLASPYGHCYQNHYGAYVDQVTIPDPVEPSLRQRMNDAGMNGYYKYAVMTPAERGLALVGTYFEQARIGFIHEPLIQDDPEKVEAEDQNEFQAILAGRSKSRGDYVSERDSILGNATVDEVVDEIERGRKISSIE